MAILNIIDKNDPTIRKISKPVDKITPRILTLLDDMKQTLRDVGGIGLAAVQVGVLRRVVIIDIGDAENSSIIELINPEIIASSGEQQEAEGCLSCKGQYAITKRPMEVTLQALDRDGVLQTYKGTDLLARAFCHETDHLDGILFLDNAVRELSPDELEND